MMKKIILSFIIPIDFNDKKDFLIQEKINWIFSKWIEYKTNFNEREHELEKEVNYINSFFMIDVDDLYEESRLLTDIFYYVKLFRNIIKLDGLTLENYSFKHYCIDNCFIVKLESNDK